VKRNLGRNSVFVDIKTHSVENGVRAAGKVLWQKGDSDDDAAFTFAVTEGRANFQHIVRVVCAQH
jgi:hypothetical protein